MADQQKFFRGQSVRVGDTPITSRKGEFDGVVVCNYAETYPTDEREILNEYFRLIEINDEGNPLRAVEWYHDSEMTLTCDNRAKGEAVIAKWKAM